MSEVRPSQINRHPEKNLAIGSGGQADALARGIERDAGSNLVLHTGEPTNVESSIFPSLR